MYIKFFKRLIDIAAGFFGLLILSPLLIFIAILVRIKLGAPVIFAQERPGRDGKIFKLYKFRSMTDARDSNGNPLSDADRLTSFGKTLRSTSLDELPELWNILKGDMSLVGPRPLLPEYLPLYTPEQNRRHHVRPGLTGHVQINGRNAIGWDEKFVMDCYYIDNLNLWLDIKILFLTVGKVLKREGIASEAVATMEPFKGSANEQG